MLCCLHLPQGLAHVLKAGLVQRPGRLVVVLHKSATSLCASENVTALQSSSGGSLRPVVQANLLKVVTMAKHRQALLELQRAQLLRCLQVCRPPPPSRHRTHCHMREVFGALCSEPGNRMEVLWLKSCAGQGQQQLCRCCCPRRVRERQEQVQQHHSVLGGCARQLQPARRCPGLTALYLSEGCAQARNL